jgi:hypothetical protein
MLEGTEWEIASKECRNDWHLNGDRDFINKEPIIFNDWRDVFLAGLAEEMAHSMDWQVPDWCEQPFRFLKAAKFINCPTEYTRALALTETKTGFRRRNMFVLLDVKEAGSGRFAKNTEKANT